MALAAEYGFNEGTGATASDSSGSGNTLTAASGAWITGRNGTGAAPGKFTGPLVGAAQPFNAFSIMMWFKAATLPPSGYRYLLSQTTGNYRVYIALYPDGHLNFYYGTGGGQSWDSTLTVTAGEWTHFAVTHSGTSGKTSRMYINGVQDPGSHVHGGPPSTFSFGTTWTVGANSGGANPLDGAIDDLRFFNEELSPTAIGEWMAVPIAEDLDFGGAATATSSTGDAAVVLSAPPALELGAVAAEATSSTSSPSMALAAPQGLPGHGSATVMSSIRMNSAHFDGVKNINLGGRTPGSTHRLMITQPGASATAPQYLNSGATHLASPGGGYRMYRNVGTSGLGDLSWRLSDTTNPLGILSVGFPHDYEVVASSYAAGNTAPSITPPAGFAGLMLQVYSVRHTGAATGALVAPSFSEYATSSTAGDSTSRYTIGIATTYVDDSGPTPTEAWSSEGAVDGAEHSLTVLVRSTEALPFTTSDRVVSGTQGRHFVDQHGDPILMKADSAWLLPRMLEDGWVGKRFYFYERARAGFNAVQIDLLGLPAIECYEEGPFIDGDWSNLNEPYWQRVDQVFDLAEEFGFSILADLYPYTKMSSDEWYAGSTPTLQTQFGEFLGARYGNRNGLLWMFGGDWYTERWAEFNPIFQRILDGIRSTESWHHPLTIDVYWESGATGDDSISYDNAYWRGKYDFSYSYTYTPQYKSIRRSIALEPGLPVLLGETSYDAHNFEAGPDTTPETIRRNPEWAYASGACGDVYGHRETWQMGRTDSEPYPGVQPYLWRNFMRVPALPGLKATRAAFEAIDWWKLNPDVSNTFLTSGQGIEPSSGTQNSGRVDPLESSYAVASTAADGTLGVVFTPTSRDITVNLSRLGPNPTAYRVDPTTGTQTPVSLAGGSIAGPGNNAAGQSDWIFVFQAEPLPTPETSLLNIMVAGTEQQAESVSVMIGGVEVPVVSISVMQGGVEVPVV